MIPQTLYNLNLFIDGVNFAGIATQVTPPKLKIKAEDYRGGGMDAPIKMDLGLEALEANFALSGISIDALRFFGLADQSAFNGVFRGAFRTHKGEVQSCVVTLRGMLTEIDMGDWKPSDKAETKFSLACSYYKLELDGLLIYEIDPIASVRIVDGLDQLADIRAALGL